MIRFGEKLRALRKSKKMTITELSNLLGYSSHSYISEIESGKKTPTVELVLSISRIFDISTDILLKDEFDIKI